MNNKHHYKNRGSAQLVHYPRMHVVSKVSKRFPRYTWEILGHLGNYIHSLVVYKLHTPSILVVYLIEYAETQQKSQQKHHLDVHFIRTSVCARIIIILISQDNNISQQSMQLITAYANIAMNKNYKHVWPSTMFDLL